ncbi:hypothetical protein BDZ97DRAFT_698349 [Flammula alnicola]|nr:hypothetical protein BDZ97DRAFT_698349 [Flammula alnicola]
MPARHQLFFWFCCGSMSYAEVSTSYDHLMGRSCCNSLSHASLLVIALEPFSASLVSYNRVIQDLSFNAYAENGAHSLPNGICILILCTCRLNLVFGRHNPLRLFYETRLYR